MNDSKPPINEKNMQHLVEWAAAVAPFVKERSAQMGRDWARSFGSMARKARS